MRLLNKIGLSPGSINHYVDEAMSLRKSSNRRMNILIESSNANHNWGDASMLHVAIRRLVELFDDVDITLLKPHPAFERSYRHAEVSSLGADNYPAWTRERRLWHHLDTMAPGGVDYLVNQWPTLANWITRGKMKAIGRDPAPRTAFLERFETADMLIVSGGGFITDVFTSTAEDVLNLIMLAHRKDVPVFMFGQGIGPLTSSRLRSKARRALPKVQRIALRERKTSRPLLRELGVPSRRITVTGDDAVSLAYSNHPETLGDGIGINLRVAFYSKLSSELYETLGLVLSEVAGDYEAPLRPIPINYAGSDSDVDSIRQILHYAGVESDGGASLGSPEAVIRQVGRCRVVVTGSYHGAVFALSQGVPVVGLSRSNYYDTKFHGVADMFGAGCTVLRTDRSDFTRALKGAIRTAWVTAPDVRLRLLEAAKHQVKKANNAYEYVSQYDVG